jgi:DNA end-binding protein Ku
MARVIWKGQISFGLVEIPVGLYSATRGDGAVHFDLLDRRDMAPIGYRRVNKRSGEEVPQDEIVRGYEIDKDEYVTVTDEDFVQANPKATRTIDIVAFVNVDEIDARFYEKPYYLAPTRRGSKAYALLREALRRTGRVGVARVVLRSRQYIGLILPFGSMLGLELLRYADELRDPSELDLPGDDLQALGVKDRELQMAERLVEELSEPWQPASFKDDYREDLLARIRAKAEVGETQVVAQPVAEGPMSAEVVDIMTLLKRSVDRAAEEKDGADRPPRKRRRGEANA